MSGKMNVMITGACGGLGRALAAECGKRGYRLFLTDINEEGLRSIQRGLERRFGVCAAVRACDLTSESGVDELLCAVDAQNIRFDMLLNVAGLDYEGAFLARKRNDLVKIVSLNNEATLRITHSILQRRRADRPFSLVFVSSLASLYPMPLKATYAASKRFLLDFSLALRLELKGQGVRVLAVCPGGMPTTPEAMRGIEAQGFWGAATTNPLETVARRTIDGVMRGKSVYIPGGLNRTLAMIGGLLPRRWVAAAIYRRWNKAQTRRPPSEAESRKAA